MVKQNLKKQPNSRRGVTKNPDLTGDNLIPAAPDLSNGKSLGNSVVEVVPPKGTNNLTEGTNKNELRVKGRSNPFVGWTSSGTLLVRVGQVVIDLRCSE